MISYHHKAIQSPIDHAPTVLTLVQPLGLLHLRSEHQSQHDNAPWGTCQLTDGIKGHPIGPKDAMQSLHGKDDQKTHVWNQHEPTIVPTWFSRQKKTGPSAHQPSNFVSTCATKHNLNILKPFRLFCLSFLKKWQNNVWLTFSWNPMILLHWLCIFKDGKSNNVWSYEPNGESTSIVWFPGPFSVVTCFHDPE